MSSNTSTNKVETKNVNTIEALKERIDYAYEIYSKLETLKIKSQNNNTNTLDVERVENNDEKLGFAYDELKQSFETNNKRIDDVLKLIPILESQLQALCQKVNTRCDCS